MMPQRPPKFPPAGRMSRLAAFTLLELLLGLALIGLLAGVLIGGGAKLFSEQPVTPDEVFWKAVGEARKAALNAGQEVHLAYADDTDHGKRLTISGPSVAKDFPLVGPPDLTVGFLPADAASGSAVILGGQVVETQTIPFVRFFEDGTCSAFRVQVRVGVASHILNIDRWTCAAVLVSSPSPTS